MTSSRTLSLLVSNAESGDTVNMVRMARELRSIGVDCEVFFAGPDSHIQSFHSKSSFHMVSTDFQEIRDAIKSRGGVVMANPVGYRHSDGGAKYQDLIRDLSKSRPIDKMVLYMGAPYRNEIITEKTRYLLVKGRKIKDPIWDYADAFVANRPVNLAYLHRDLPRSKKTPSHVSRYMVHSEDVPTKVMSKGAFDRRRKSVVFCTRIAHMKRFKLFVDSMTEAKALRPDEGFRCVMAGLVTARFDSMKFTALQEEGAVDLYFGKYVKKDQPRIYAEGAFMADFSMEPEFDAEGFQNSTLEAVLGGVLPIVGPGWDPLRGKGLLELPESTRRERVNPKKDRRACAETLIYAMVDMPYREYRERMTALQELLRGPQHEARTVAKRLSKFLFT